MGRGRNGFVTSSNKKLTPTSKPLVLGLEGYRNNKSLSPQDVEVAKRLTKEQLAYILFKGGNTVSEGTTISSSRTKPRLGPSNR